MFGPRQEEQTPPARDVCIELILKYEGGLVNNKKDPGRLTNMGISQRAYPHLDIANLTRMEASRIYERDYWDEVSGGSLPPGVNLMVFDAAVNQGAQTARRMLQEALRVSADGVIGPITLGVLGRHKNIESLVRKIAVLRLERYRTTHNTEVFFKKLWAPRMFDVIRDSLALLPRED